MLKIDKIIKRLFDIVFSILAILLFGWVIVLLIVIATIDTKLFGLFRQKRIGLNGEDFYIFKIRTMKINYKISTTITTVNDPRLTPLGKILRKYKLDELPQLINVLLGKMSFVGPRPDVRGFADNLAGEDKIILSVKPGITGPASLYFRKEEELLTLQEDPCKYNRNIIWPKKVVINKEYVKNYTFKKDLQILYKTVFHV